MADEELSIRDALSSALDSASDPSAGGGGASPGAAAVQPTKEVALSPSTSSSPPSSAPATGPGYLQQSKPPAGVPPSQQSEQSAPGGSPGEPPPAVRAPAAWKPELREKWSILPPDVQAEVLRREREINQTLQSSVDARKQVEQMQKTAAPYQHLIAMEGGDPMAAFGDYLRTVALLRGGTPNEKAQALAQAVMKFGIDISHLDNALLATMGGQPRQAQPQQPQQFNDPRLDDLLATIEKNKAAREAEVSQSAVSEIESFSNDAAHEFLNDVRDDMADMLDLAAKRSRVMSLKEAYDRACMMNPGISKIIEQRKLASAATAGRGIIAGKTRAAASITDRAARTSGAGDRPMSIKEALDAAMSNHT